MVYTRTHLRVRFSHILLGLLLALPFLLSADPIESNTSIEENVIILYEGDNEDDVSYDIHVRADKVNKNMVIQLTAKDRGTYIVELLAKGFKPMAKQSFQTKRAGQHVEIVIPMLSYVAGLEAIKVSSANGAQVVPL